MLEIINGDELYEAARELRVDLAAPLTDIEKAVIGWQYKRHGGFFSALWEAIVKADSGNLVRLYRAFPDQVLGYAAYGHNPGWWEDVENKMRAKGA